MPGSRRVALGRVVGAHGVHGELRIAWLGDGPENLLRATDLWLAPGPDAEARMRKLEVLGFGSAAGSDLRLRLRDIDDREAALELKGQWVFGDARRLEPLGDDEFYWHQLIGCAVETEDGRALGQVQELWETGPHDVLVVDGESGQHLIPTAREFLREVDPEGRRLVVAPIPGLLEAEATAEEREEEAEPHGAAGNPADAGGRD